MKIMTAAANMSEIFDQQHEKNLGLNQLVLTHDLAIPVQCSLSVELPSHKTPFKNITVPDIKIIKLYEKPSELRMKHE